MRGLIKGTVVAMAAAVVLAMVPGVSAASAEALTPWWGVTSGSQPTNLVSGEPGHIVVTAENRGDAASSGEVTISDVLPADLTATGIEGVAGERVGLSGNHPSLRGAASDYTRRSGRWQHQASQRRAQLS